MEIGSYGNITFEITKENFLTIKSMTREKKSKWEEHAILNDLSFLEFRGRELNTITFDMQLIDSLGSDITGTLTKLNLTEPLLLSRCEIYEPFASVITFAVP